MGAWRAIRHRLEEGLPDGVRLRYVGRPWRREPERGLPRPRTRSSRTGSPARRLPSTSLELTGNRPRRRNLGGRTLSRGLALLSPEKGRVRPSHRRRRLRHRAPGRRAPRRGADLLRSGRAQRSRAHPRRRRRARPRPRGLRPDPARRRERDGREGRGRHPRRARRRRGRLPERDVRLLCDPPGRRPPRRMRSPCSASTTVCRSTQLWSPGTGLPREGADVVEAALPAPAAEMLGLAPGDDIAPRGHRRPDPEGRRQAHGHVPRRRSARSVLVGPPTRDRRRADDRLTTYGPFCRRTKTHSPRWRDRRQTSPGERPSARAASPSPRCRNFVRTSRRCRGNLNEGASRAVIGRHRARHRARPHRPPADGHAPPGC